MTDWSRYARYLASDEWRAKRERVMVRAGWECEVDNCVRTAHEVHHLTYDRLYDEDQSDLIALCVACHDTLTEIDGRVGIGCLGSTLAREAGDDCFCLVCELQRKGTTLARKLRREFVAAMNRDLHERLLMRYGGVPRPRTRYAGVSRRNDLPPAMICRQTGRPAGTIAGCACDSCRWVAMLESDFREREERETDEQA